MNRTIRVERLDILRKRPLRQLVFRKQVAMRELTSREKSVLRMNIMRQRIASNLQHFEECYKLDMGPTFP